MCLLIKLKILIIVFDFLYALDVYKCMLFEMVNTKNVSALAIKIILFNNIFTIKKHYYYIITSRDKMKKSSEISDFSLNPSFRTSSRTVIFANE